MKKMQMEISTGQKIRELRQKAGKHQSDIAQLLDISVPAYSKIETGLTDINLTRLKQIAKIFEVTPSSLLPGVTESEEFNNILGEKDALVNNLQLQINILQSKLISTYEKLEKLRAID